MAETLNDSDVLNEFGSFIPVLALLQVMLASAPDG